MLYPVFTHIGASRARFLGHPVPENVADTANAVGGAQDVVDTVDDVDKAGTVKEGS